MVDNSTTNNNGQQLPGQDLHRRGGSQVVDHDGHGSMLQPEAWPVLTATGYILLAVAGPGVLSLAWNMAQLGWIAGPAAIILLSFLTWIASIILCDFYFSPHDPDKRNPSYMHVIRSYLGAGRTANVKICWVIQYLNLFVIASLYTDSASQMMADIEWVSKCSNSNNVNVDDSIKIPCWVYQKPYYIVFGVTQILLSQISDFRRLRWLILLCFGAFLIFSSIGVGLSFTKIASNNWSIKGSLEPQGNINMTRAKKTWLIFKALGHISDGFDFSSVLLEIEDTIGRGLPAQEAQKIMRKAIHYGLPATTCVYLFFGCLGYAALGEDSPEYIFLYGFYKPHWLLNIANAAMVLHYAGAYQLFIQPIFAMFEKAVVKRFSPDNEFIKRKIKIWTSEFKLFQLVLRTFFVIVTTLLSMFLAIYLDILELIKILAFWPIVFYFPVKIYIMEKKIPMWSAKGLGLQIMSFGILIVTIAVAAANIVEVFLEDSYNPIMPNRYPG
ncbi:amino acid permease 3-like [Juglans microcarpa x Juglans regia]|uniref:amino acid permease 3-like n=1 Tax=Juglans microcarpa x Juglans regia TaxID=2249226 RepID=UPI001B7EDC6A|nr:amino acid permease 3-like [Juglans microcarpa x Juglans regia]